MATEFGAMNDDDILQAIMDEMDGPVEAEEAKPQGQTKVQSETEDVSDVNPTDDEESEDEAEDTQDEEETEESEEEDWFPNDLSELAEAMQVDLDALKAIKVKTKVDGVESDVPLGEVIKNYQINKSLTERSEQLAHNRKAFEQQATEFQAARDQQIQQWQMWNGVLEQRLKDQVGAIDWQQLREDDPAEYAAKRQEFTERIILRRKLHSRHRLMLMNVPSSGSSSLNKRCKKTSRRSLNLSRIGKVNLTRCVRR